MNRNDYLQEAIDDLTRFELLKEKFNLSEVELKDFIIDLVDDKGISHFNRAFIANTFLRMHIYKEGKTLETKEFWQEKVYELFDEYLSLETIRESPLNFYYLNDDSRGRNNTIFLYEKASERFRKFLLEKDENFIKYLRIIVRSRTLPNDGTFVVEPFFFQYFPNPNFFVDKLRTIELQEDDLILIRNILLNDNYNIFSRSRRNIIIEPDEEDYKFLHDYLKRIGSIREDDPGLRDIRF